MAGHKQKKKHKSKGSSSSKYTGPIDCLTTEDYYQKAPEFRIWLKLHTNQYIEDLSSAEAMKYFETKFMSKWNRGKLESMYYCGIPPHIFEQTKRTKHQWGFLNHMSESEQFHLATTKDSVQVLTNKKTQPRPVVKPPSASSVPAGPSTSNHHGQGLSKSTWTKRLREEAKIHEEELVPRETGRAGTIEKRRAKAAKIHASSHDREASRDGLDLSESMTMGGSDDVQKRISQQKEEAQVRQAQKRQKMESLEAKEEQRMQAFIQQMGLNVGSDTKIVIPKRK